MDLFTYIYLFSIMYTQLKTQPKTLSKFSCDQRKAKNISSKTYVNLSYDNLFQNQIMRHLESILKDFRISESQK